MVIVVTDEVGDDEDQLEEAIAAAPAAKVPVYVLGSPALFGRSEGHMNYTDPKTKQTYYNLAGPPGARERPPGEDPPAVLVRRRPVRRPRRRLRPLRPEPAGRRDRGDLFRHPVGPSRLSFDPDAMREYKPDWVSRDQYEPERPEAPDPQGRHRGRG